MTVATAARQAPQQTGFISPLQSAPDVEAQTMLAFLEGQAGDVITKLYAYLERHGQQHRQLDNAATLLAAAGELYAQGDYNRAIGQAYYAYREIAILRSQIPELPDL